MVKRSRGDFKCKYCKEEKDGGGATRFKEHLAHRGENVKDCPSVPTEVKEFFSEQLDRNKVRAKARARERVLRDQAARGRHIDLEEEGG